MAASFESHQIEWIAIKPFFFGTKAFSDHNYLINIDIRDNWTFLTIGCYKFIKKIKLLVNLVEEIDFQPTSCQSMYGFISKETLKIQSDIIPFNFREDIQSRNSCIHSIIKTPNKNPLSIVWSELVVANVMYLWMFAKEDEHESNLTILSKKQNNKSPFKQQMP